MIIVLLFAKTRLLFGEWMGNLEEEQSYEVTHSKKFYFVKVIVAKCFICQILKYTKLIKSMWHAKNAN